MTDTTDLLVFLLVVGLRIGVPLLIPRYPLPAILTAMIIDAADQTIFQNYTNLNLDNYQSYDKALDIYYLAIAYISVLRNWTNLYAVDVARFLWYYRLFGVAAFELLDIRALLLIFPNTFEYYFDWYEGVRTRWNPLRWLTHRRILFAAAFIWIFIKLPQEYWIHIAQLDTTDLIKEDILGVPSDTPWGEALSENLWVFPVLIIIGVVLALVGRRLWRRLPPADYPMTFDANVHADEHVTAERAPRGRDTRYALVEKIALIGLMTIIFAQLIPGLEASPLEISIGVAFFIVVNSLVSYWLAKRGTHWKSMLTEFAGMWIVNIGIAALYTVILGDDVRFNVLLFLTFIMTIVITFYDRYRPIYEQRVAAAADAPAATQQP